LIRLEFVTPPVHAAWSDTTAVACPALHAVLPAAALHWHEHVPAPVPVTVSTSLDAPSPVGHVGRALAANPTSCHPFGAGSVHTKPAVHAGSSQSMCPLQSLSIPSSQISTGPVLVQLGTGASVPVSAPPSPPLLPSPSPPPSPLPPSSLPSAK
jgi:hypothetical protein